MSHDGQYCIANSAWIGSACVPNKRSHGTINPDDAMDHKGFYMTRFFRAGDPAANLYTIPDEHGVSINWCPENYRYGSYSDVDFNGWSFSNNSDYVVGVQQGTLVAAGVWVVKWGTNTWTCLTGQNSDGATFVSPRLFFSSDAGIGSSRRINSSTRSNRGAAALADFSGGARSITLPEGATGVDLYSLTGRQVWHYACGPSADRTVPVPRGSGLTGTLVVRLRHAD